MKTTIDIADGLLEEARERARVEGTTVRALVERALLVLRLGQVADDHKRAPVAVTEVAESTSWTLPWSVVLQTLT